MSVTTSFATSHREDDTSMIAPRDACQSQSPQPMEVDEPPLLATVRMAKRERVCVLLHAGTHWSSVVAIGNSRHQ